MHVKDETWLKLRRLITFSSVIACILLYIIGSVEIESIHGLSHESDHAEIHTIESESDPCHVSLYHQERSGACDHEAHISKNNTCSFCDAQLHQSHLFLSLNGDLAPLTITDTTSECVQDLFSETLPCLRGRAPPIV